MDRKEIGEKLVTDIIDRYILSEDFRNDAVYFVYKEILVKLNEKIAGLGDCFTVDAFDETGIFKPEMAEKFKSGMEERKNEKKLIQKLFHEAFNYSPEYEKCIDPRNDIIFGEHVGYSPNRKTDGLYDTCDGCINSKGCITCVNYDQKQVKG